MDEKKVERESNVESKPLNKNRYGRKSDKEGSYKTHKSTFEVIENVC